MPLGLLTVQALHASGASIGLPYLGATFSVTAPSFSVRRRLVHAADGPDGLSRTEIPYGTYTLSVRGTSTVTEAITVGGSSVVASGTTYLFPTPVPVSVT